MTFLDYRLNTRYRYGFRGGPNFATLHKRTRGGQTTSRSLREYPLHRYSADYAAMSDEERAQIRDALWVAMGSCNRFRFRDWNDWKVENQALGVGDGTATPIQLFKDYHFGPYTKRRPIRLPYSIAMTADGAPFTDMVVDPLTGIATPDTEWPEGAVLAYSCRFDVRVRFQDDYVELVAEAPNITTSNVVLVEEFL